MRIALCEICDKRTAKYVCQNCGRLVCEICIIPGPTICIECLEKTGEQKPKFLWSEGAPSYRDPFFLFFLSIVMIFIGMSLVILSTLLGGTVQGGAIVMVGPIPIIIGAGVDPLMAIILALALTIMGILIFYLLRRRRYYVL